MDVERIREDFPYLKNEETKDIAYLDNAATSQKPQCVLDALTDFYSKHNANPNRGAYRLSYEATLLYEGARQKVADFIGASTKDEIVFTRSATEAINLVAYSYGLEHLKPGDEVLVSVMEHHANFVSWQWVCQKTGADLKVFYLDDDYGFDMQDFKEKLTDKTKLVAFTAQSNVLSSKIPIDEVIALAHAVGAITMVDGAQYTAHHPVDVTEMDVDFYAFSGHKLFAPMGIGVLYGKKELLDALSPFNYGGDMIEYVYEDHTRFAQTPEKFEAGTQNVGGAYALGAAIDYLSSLGLEHIAKREQALADYTLKRLKELDFVDVYVSKENFEGTNIIFNVKNVHPHDVASILDFSKVAIRTGHHCAQVLHRYLGLNSTCRVSLAFYNTEEEIDRFIEALWQVKEMLA